MRRRERTARLRRTCTRDWFLLAAGTALGVVGLLAVGGCAREQLTEAASIKGSARSQVTPAAGRSELSGKVGFPIEKLREKPPRFSSRMEDTQNASRRQPEQTLTNMPTELETVNPNPLPLAVIAVRHTSGFTNEQTASLVQLNEAFLKHLEAERAGNLAVGSVTPKAMPDAVPTIGTSSPESVEPLISEESADDVGSQQREERTWNAAQSASDARFKSLFGYSAFNAMQLERARENATPIGAR